MRDGQPAARSAWKTVLGAIVLFAAVDCGVFRSGLYGWLAKPDSSSGWVSRRVLYEPSVRAVGDGPAVLLLGDSMMAEGCSCEDLARRLGEPAVTVVDGSVPATPLRVWPFVFERIPPPPGGWSLVVAGLSEYDDGCCEDAFADHDEDIAFLGPMLGFDEVAEIAGEFTDPAARQALWLSVFCKTFAWRRDLRDLLAAPWPRYREVRRQLGRLRWGAPYEGLTGSLAGVHVDGDRIVGLSEDQADVAAMLHHRHWPQRFVDNHDYRVRWLGRLADLVAAAGAELVIVRMPIDMLGPPPGRVPSARAVAELARRPHVHVLAADTFAALERPENFADALHLNRTGRQAFTRMLAAALLADFGERLGR